LGKDSDSVLKSIQSLTNNAPALAALPAQLQGLETRFESAVKSITALESGITQIKDNLAAFEARIAALENDFKTIGADASAAASKAVASALANTGQPAPTGGGGNAGEKPEVPAAKTFPERVKVLKSAGKSHTDAVIQAMKDDPGAHRAWLAAGGSAHF
jgi:hypothetical protein